MDRRHILGDRTRPAWAGSRAHPGWRAAWVLVCMLSAGCSSSMVAEPIGIGSDRDALKQSPCACVEIPQRYDRWRHA